MRSRKGNKLNTAIELTSLLDVIFIVLMIVICNQQINMETKSAEAEVMVSEAAAEMEQAEALKEEAADMAAEADSEKLLYEEFIENNRSMFEQYVTVTVRIDYLPSDIRNRTIRLLINDAEEKTMKLSGNDTKEAFSAFEEELENAAAQAEAEGKPVFISINTDRILYRDEKKAEEILSLVFEKYENLYYRKTGAQ